MKARLALAATTAAAALAVAGAAQAHVTVHPNALPSGGETVIAIDVPSEEPTASTTRVDVRLPDGVYAASTTAMPGWTARVITKRLAKPVRTDDGSVDTRVDRIVFTGRIAPGHYMALPVLLLVPEAKAGTLLAFKAVQTYSNGKVERWIGSPGSETPAPQVLIRSASSPVLDYPAGASAARSGTGRSLKGFAIGFPLAGLGAYLLGRRRRLA